MFYPFPSITNIADVLPHIEEREGFVVEKKHWYTNVRYSKSAMSLGSLEWDSSDPVGSAIRRECRGLMFDTNSGELIARPYHKFFNLNEPNGLSIKNFANASGRVVVLEKLDGSMVFPIPTLDGSGAKFVLVTKAGITSVSMDANMWLINNPEKAEGYKKFIEYCLYGRITPIFEWCSRSNREVIDYPEERLVLTAIRLNTAGAYIPHKTLTYFAKTYSIDFVGIYAYKDLDSGLIENIYSQELSKGEGVVVRIDAPRATAWGGAVGYGHMAKIKSMAYLRIHKAKEYISLEKNIIATILADQLDDLLPLLPEPDCHRLLGFSKAFWVGLEDTMSQLVDVYLADGAEYGPNEQKEFALGFVSSLPPHIRPFMYELRRGQVPIKDVMVKAIRKSLTSQSKINSVRWLWGGADWRYNVI